MISIWDLDQGNVPKPVPRKVNCMALTGNIVTDDDTEIQELDQERVYTYLGVDQNDGFQHSKMKLEDKKRIQQESTIDPKN